MVFVDVGPDAPGISLLRVDYHHGIRQGVQHLAALGHRDIAFISARCACIQRNRGWRRFIARCGSAASR